MARTSPKTKRAGPSVRAFRRFVYDFPNQITAGVEAAESVKVPRGRFSRVVVCGMGGSALAADLANAWLDLNPDIFVHRDFGLPNEADAESLVLVVSHSGDTAETLSAFDEAVKAGRSVIAITTGGELAKRAGKFGIPLVKLTRTDAPPRLNTGLHLAAIATVLARAGVIDDHESELVEAAAEIAQDRALEERGRALARQIGVRLPLIYSSSSNAVLARNWKIKINETAKRAAFWNVVPETAHNEIVAFGDGADYFVLMALIDGDDDKRVRRSVKVIEDIARGLKWPVTSVELKGSSRLAKILHTVWLGDWFALALAELHENDPSATPLIDIYKKKISR